VSDADEKTPLEGALIQIKELGISTRTDEEGHYHFYNLCPGTFTFLLSHSDCDTLFVRIRVEKSIVRNFQLPHHYNVLSSVQVRSLKNDPRQLVRDVLKGRDVQETRGQSLGEILRRITGVQVLQTGSTIFKPVIHGLHSQRVILLNQEVRLEGQQWGSEHAPEIDPFIADKFVVLKGAGAIRYGSDAIGGAILVEPRPLIFDQRFRGEVNTGYFSNNRQYVVNVQLEENLKHMPAFSWRAHATPDYRS
jgi:iron complex outermembrane receptor protein